MHTDRQETSERPAAGGARRRPRRWRLTALSLAAVTALAGAVGVGVVGVGVEAYPGLARTAGSTAPAAIVWGECPAQSEAAAQATPRDAAQECGTLRVPMDYRRPRGETITIAVSRIRAAEPTARRGVLLFNPGGPGGAGLDVPSLLKPMLPAGVADRYDLIGFDPRGVGHSTPITCGRDLTEVVRDLDKLMPFPDADGSIADTVRFGRAVADGCAAHGGKLLPFVTTANTARDMDGIRAALGERKISYYGLSYGTYLGAVYASLFPGRTDRFVLDSSVDPTLRDNEDSHTYGQGMADRFPDLARHAAANDDTIGYGTTVAEVRATYLTVADTLQRQPATVQGSPIPLTGNLLRLFTFLFSHNDQSVVDGLGPLWQAARAYAEGTATADDAAVVAGTVNGFAAQAVTPGVPVDNFHAVGTAVMCNDSAWPRDLRRYARDVARDRREFPLTAGMPYNVWPCTFWRSKPVEPPVAVTDAGPRNVLIVQNQRDAATPLVSARGMRDAFGRRAVLVDVDAGGHGVLIAPERNRCAVTALGDFLTDGELPRRDRTCPKN